MKCLRNERGIIMNLAKFPRRRYTQGKTPLEFLHNFSKALGGPNNYLVRLLGVETTKVVPLDSNCVDLIQQVKDELAAEGRKGHIIPGGGSNVIGATGYVACAQEILEQTFDMGLNLDYVVTTSGSGGTHGGLLVGLLGNNSNIPIIGVSVRANKEKQEK